MQPRGIRNNNPGNIRLSKTRWKGQKEEQVDRDFIEFETETDGLRALFRLLLTYHLKYGLDTVESIINRYAPPRENATDHYIYSVARSVGVKRNALLDLTQPKTMAAVARAIVRHENGHPPAGVPEYWYPPEIYAAALARVFGQEGETA